MSSFGRVQVLTHLVHVVVDDAMVKQCTGFRHRLLGQQRIALEQVDGARRRLHGTCRSDARPHPVDDTDTMDTPSSALDTGVKQRSSASAALRLRPGTTAQNH